MAELLERPGPWTYEDLQEIPEHLWARWRFEIVDGGLEVSPAPGMRHEVVSVNLAIVLNALLRPAKVAVTTVGVDLHPTYRIPDLVVVDATTAARDVNTITPREVMLAIEVVSPGSVTRDRITKPAQYASAGIGAFWRVEPKDGLSITASVLDRDAAVFRELGTWREGERLEVEEPFPVAFEVSELLP